MKIIILLIFLNFGLNYSYSQEKIFVPPDSSTSVEGLTFNLFGKEINFTSLSPEKLFQLYLNSTKDNTYENCCPEISSYFVNKEIISGSGHSDATFYFLGNNLFQISIQIEWDEETDKELDNLISQFKMYKSTDNYEEALGRDITTEFYKNGNYQIEISYLRFKVCSIVDENLKTEVKKVYPSFQQDY